MKVTNLFFDNLEATCKLCKNLPYGVAVVQSSTRLAYRYWLVATCLIVAPLGCSVQNVSVRAKGYGIQARLSYHACDDVYLFSDRSMVMSNAAKMIELRAKLAVASDAEKAELQVEIDAIGKKFASDDSFVPKGWRQVIGRIDPLPLSTVGELGPIDDKAIAGVPASVANDVVHGEFAKGTTIKAFLERLKGKTFFTLPELAVACGFDSEERNLNQIVGSASFRAVIVSFAKKGRIIKAKKGPSNGATSVDSVKELAATIDL